MKRCVGDLGSNEKPLLIVIDRDSSGLLKVFAGGQTLYPGQRWSLLQVLGSTKHTLRRLPAAVVTPYTCRVIRSLTRSVIVAGRRTGRDIPTQRHF